MRTELLDYIGTLDLGGYALSGEVPWTESGTPLYLKNPKRIYVDLDQYQQSPFIQTLNGQTISNEIGTVRVYFSNDAKQLPPNYETLVSELRLGKDLTTIQGVNRRECDVSTEFENDLLITELEFRYIKLSI
jgi:hypothetical protein